MCEASPARCSSGALRRITYRAARPNPLFECWLQDLATCAEPAPCSRRRVLEALEALRRYPVPLRSGAECAILKGFGKKLCAHLDAKLREHAAHSRAETSSAGEDISPPTISCGSSPSRKSSSGSNGIKRYKPAYGSGGFAILVALMEHVSENTVKMSLSKEHLIEKAQPMCQDSLTRPRPDSHYTAWASMARLISKGLVSKTKHKKAEYSLTNEGFLLATELAKDYNNKPTTNDLINSQLDSFENVSVSQAKNCVIEDICATQKAAIQFEQVSHTELDCAYIEMPGGAFDIILLIDKQETSGTSKKNDPTVAQFNKYNDLRHEYRHLKVGDFTWIAKHRATGEELVLPYIVERKRMDDLGASIKDGRFHEQKFRLKKCGLANVLYLVENYGSNKHVGLPVQSLLQAIANTRIQSGFKIHMTDSLANSVRFLAMMTKRLTIEYKDKSLKGGNGDPAGETLMTFAYFNKASTKSKTLTVKETFIKLLLQLKGVSVERALAITKAYPTPRSLIETYSNCDRKEGEMLLASLKNGELCRNVGPSVSKSIYQLFTINHLQ